MIDLFYVGLTIVFFAVTWGFIVVCERLMEEKRKEHTVSHRRPDHAGSIHLPCACSAKTEMVRMDVFSWLQPIFYMVVLLALAKPLCIVS